MFFGIVSISAVCVILAYSGWERHDIPTGTERISVTTLQSEMGYLPALKEGIVGWFQFDNRREQDLSCCGITNRTEEKSNNKISNKRFELADEYSAPCHLQKIITKAKPEYTSKPAKDYPTFSKEYFIYNTRSLLGRIGYDSNRYYRGRITHDENGGTSDEAGVNIKQKVKSNAYQNIIRYTEVKIKFFLDRDSPGSTANKADDYSYGQIDGGEDNIIVNDIDKYSDEYRDDFNDPTIDKVPTVINVMKYYLAALILMNKAMEIIGRQAKARHKISLLKYRGATNKPSGHRSSRIPGRRPDMGCQHDKRRSNIGRSRRKESSYPLPRPRNLATTRSLPNRGLHLYQRVPPINERDNRYGSTFILSSVSDQRYSRYKFHRRDSKLADEGPTLSDSMYTREIPISAERQKKMLLARKLLQLEANISYTGSSMAFYEKLSLLVAGFVIEKF